MSLAEIAIAGGSAGVIEAIPWTSFASCHTALSFLPVHDIEKEKPPDKRAVCSLLGTVATAWYLVLHVHERVTRSFRFVGSFTSAPLAMPA